MSRQRDQCIQRLAVHQGCSRLPTLAPGFTLRVLPEGRGGGPRAPYDRPKSNQMGWGPRGAVGPFVTVICPAAEITNTFLSEGLAATGLRALMPYSCGRTGVGVGLGEGMERGYGGQQAAARGRNACCPPTCPQRLPWRLSKRQASH